MTVYYVFHFEYGGKVIYKARHASGMKEASLEVQDRTIDYGTCRCGFSMVNPNSMLHVKIAFIRNKQPILPL